jgi:hypothetical protein
MRTVLILLITMVTASTAAEIPLALVQTIGGDEGEVFLHNPQSLRYAPDGTHYLLNAGECQVIHFDADWNELNSFGRCGGGPGEFENAVGMMLEGDEVWVFEMAKIVVYGLDGEYRRLLKHENTYAAPARLGERIVVLLGTGDHPAAFIDDAGVAVEPFGPECPADFFEAFKACRNMVILPHDEGLCLMANLVDGRATLIGEDGRPVWDRLLIEHEDDSVIKKTEDGEETNVTMSLSLTMGRGCRDSRGRYWMVEVPPEDDTPMYIHVLGADLEPLVAPFAMPDGIFTWEVVEAPDGRLVFVSSGESTIYVWDVDPSLPSS